MIHASLHSSLPIVPDRVLPNPVDAAAYTLQHHIAEQERFCLTLELLADKLPDEADPHDCLVAAKAIVPVVKRAHCFEEQQLHPLLMKHEGSSGDLAHTLARLRFEHLGDEVFAEDLCHALRQFATERRACNVESLAWMLRGFFEGLRRHLAFEREHILPRLREDSPTP